jgi:hypothetical protein
MSNEKESKNVLLLLVLVWNEIASLHGSLEVQQPIRNCTSSQQSLINAAIEGY